MIPRTNSLSSKLLSCARARVVCLGPSRSVCFPFTEPGPCMNTRLFFSTHTQNGQLADREEIFAEFDKKVYWIRIGDYTFKLK